MKKILLALMAVVCLFMCSCEGKEDSSKFTKKSIQGVWSGQCGIIIMTEDWYFELFPGIISGDKPEDDPGTYFDEKTRRWILSDYAYWKLGRRPQEYIFHEESQLLILHDPIDFTWAIEKIDKNTIKMNYFVLYRDANITYEIIYDGAERPKGIKVYQKEADGTLVELKHEGEYISYSI